MRSRGSMCGGIGIWRLIFVGVVGVYAIGGPSDLKKKEENQNTKWDLI
ncbi:hypothetical protein CJF31_00002301 [Rutstroemia sp. NJR-2017a BVV2]|nr:hypothetical protein CJF31_00002301 [Rutstroemia sp. NJR-2017a BVV2]